MTAFGNRCVSCDHGRGAYGSEFDNQSLERVLRKFYLLMEGSCKYEKIFIGVLCNGELLFCEYG